MPAEAKTFSFPQKSSCTSSYLRSYGPHKMDRRNLRAVKLVKTPFAVLAACMLCCVVPLSLISSGVLEMSARMWGITGVTGAIISAAVLALWLAKGSRNALFNVKACGCASNARCHTVASDSGSQNETDAPIACTLSGNDYQVRVNWIRELNVRSLRHAERSPSTLRLSYSADATADVQQLVQAEQDCCAFLKFQQIDTPDGILLTITTPAEMDAAAADAVLTPFTSHNMSTAQPLSS